jgi:glycosyltransferase involved in cell wall biosynthesis
MMTFRVAYIIGQLSLGGAEQQLYHLLSALNRPRFSPVVITLGTTPDEYWKKPITDLGIPVHHVPRCFSRIVRAHRIAVILRAAQVKIVHSWSFHTNPYAALAGRLAGVPLRLGSMRENYQLITAGLVRRLGYRGLDALTTNSQSAARQMNELTPVPVRFISNAVDIPLPVDSSSRLRLKSELGFCDSEILVGNIARLDSNKNHAMLLRTFAALTNKWPQLRLVIIGDGPLKTQLSLMAHELGIASKVIFTGGRPLAARYLSAMDVCCMTSYTEGMPNLVMEAMAAGLPVVSTRCGDCIDLIEPDVSGYLVSVDDDVSLATHLDLLLSNSELRSRMGRAGREKMRNDYSVEKLARRTIRVYDDLVIEKKMLPASDSHKVTVL